MLKIVVFVCGSGEFMEFYSTSLNPFMSSSSNPKSCFFWFFFISEPAAFLLCVNMYESVTHSGFYRCKILIFLTLLHLAPQGRNLFFCSALSSEWLCAYFIFIQQERK